MSEQIIDWDLALIQKYNYSGPRYTSYPTALEFSPQFGAAEFDAAVARYPQRPLSLYVHIPFCHKLCYFCGCNKIVTRQQHKADQYLDVLEQEIIHRAPLFATRQVKQLHWGGGTPTYLNKAQISRLMDLLRSHFHFSAEAEISIEVDPREIELDVLDHLRAEGFNRLSMGVQDFNKEVQRLVNREQDEAFIFDLLNHAREIGFTSTNIDLIYGLPKQTPESFAFTLQKVAELNPDRLSVFNYAHLPTLFAAQRKIKDADLPSAEQKLEILQETIGSLTTAGYQFIGMDHFARPDDELAVALKQYYQQVAEQGNALWRGIALTRDDCLRRDVIKALICNFQLDIAAVEAQWDVDFASYFAEDLKLLAPLAHDGLVAVDDKVIQVTAKGRLLIRNICMCFDAYLRQKARMQQFSRVI